MRQFSIICYLSRDSWQCMLLHRNCLFHLKHAAIIARFPQTKLWGNRAHLSTRYLPTSSRLLIIVTKAESERGKENAALKYMTKPSNSNPTTSLISSKLKVSIQRPNEHVNAALQGRVTSLERLFESTTMAPSVTIDNDSDFNPIASLPTKASSFNARTLLLAPPSISSHEESLRNVLASHDRAVTDLQMLDRLSAGLVTLPDSTYDLILILTDADGTRNESSQLLGRDVFGRIVQALKAGGKLQAQDGTFGQAAAENREAILAGLVVESGGMVKPDYSASEAVPLRLRRKDKGAVSSAGPPVATAAVPLNGKRKSVDISASKPAGVGFVDFSDDFGDPMITGEDDDDELIDEDTLLTEEDLRRPVTIRKSTFSELIPCGEQDNPYYDKIQ